ncbi:hypothetical protein FHR32_000971 [Streptosporangium album]|uniref:Secreted protein n=1 Tax=Streptosporangium album TaxID=47479 RepID=A0A7W7RR49_9ACTN|nr:hypothetical protein [Streptosporangium album]MBB4936666.1 hypothetical protein [Streptosporangium album]
MFCTAAMGVMWAASASCSTLTFDSPMWRTLALVPQLLQRADLVGQRHRGVHRVQLQQVDPLHPQPLQAQLHGPPQQRHRGLALSRGPPDVRLVGRAMWARPAVSPG